MRQHRKEAFLQFARERTAELFGIAFALAGRQDAAEKLLQTGLEKTLSDRPRCPANLRTR